MQCIKCIYSWHIPLILHIPFFFRHWVINHITTWFTSAVSRVYLILGGCGILSNAQGLSSELFLVFCVCTMCFSTPCFSHRTGLRCSWILVSISTYSAKLRTAYIWSVLLYIGWAQLPSSNSIMYQSLSLWIFHLILRLGRFAPHVLVWWPWIDNSKRGLVNAPRRHFIEDMCDIQSWQGMENQVRTYSVGQILGLSRDVVQFTIWPGSVEV